MKLSFLEIILLRTILNLSGEMEPGQDGKEVHSSRKLNGQESSQRRHFSNNTKEVVESCNTYSKDAKKQIDELNKTKEDEYMKENPLTIPEGTDEQKATYKKEYAATKKAYLDKDQEVIDLNKKLNEEYTKLVKEEHDIKVESETLKIVKKYFNEWGEKIGFVPDEDELVEKVEVKLK